MGGKESNVCLVARQAESDFYWKGISDLRYTCTAQVSRERNREYRLWLNWKAARVLHNYLLKKKKKKKKYQQPCSAEGNHEQVTKHGQTIETKTTTKHVQRFIWHLGPKRGTTLVWVDARRSHTTTSTHALMQVRKALFQHHWKTNDTHNVDSNISDSQRKTYREYPLSVIYISWYKKIIIFNIWHFEQNRKSHNSEGLGYKTKDEKSHNSEGLGYKTKDETRSFHFLLHHCSFYSS